MAQNVSSIIVTPNHSIHLMYVLRTVHVLLLINVRVLTVIMDMNVSSLIVMENLPIQPPCVRLMELV